MFWWTIRLALFTNALNVDICFPGEGYRYLCWSICYRCLCWSICYRYLCWSICYRCLCLSICYRYLCLSICYRCLCLSIFRDRQNPQCDTPCQFFSILNGNLPDENEIVLPWLSNHLGYYNIVFSCTMEVSTTEWVKSVCKEPSGPIRIVKSATC